MRKNSPCAPHMRLSGDYTWCSSAKQSSCWADTSPLPWVLCQFRECGRINNVSHSSPCSVATRTAIVGELSGQLSLLFNVREILETLTWLPCYTHKTSFPLFKGSVLESLWCKNLTLVKGLSSVLSNLCIFLSWWKEEENNIQERGQVPARVQWKAHCSSCHSYLTP